MEEEEDAFYSGEDEDIAEDDQDFEEELEELPDISDDDVALDGPGDLDTPAAKRPKVE